MKFLVVYTCLLMSLFLASCASRNASAQDSKPEFKVTTENTGDTLSILDENSETVIEIRSETGIGSASFELVSGSMPDALLLRLHMKGLEDFQIRSTQKTIAASLSKGEVFTLISQRVISSGRELPIRTIDPLWMDIDIVSPDEKKTPSEDSYFEITVPAEFLRQTGNFFEIHWIDFYR